MIHRCFLLAIACFIVASGASASEDAALLHANRLLRATILVDGHNDLPWAIRTYTEAPGDVAAYDLRKRTPGHTDLQRLREGGVGAQFWSVYTPGNGHGAFARTQLEQIDLARRVIERYPKDLQLALTVDDIRAAHRNGRIASLLGMEGGDAIENSLGALRAYYDLGVRYMTLTHNSHNDWADAATQTPAAHHGLTVFGEDVVREMNRLGMLVDLSHVSAETMDDALRVSAAPVIFSHSNARAVCDVPRNVPDDILARIRTNGGVVMVNFVAGFVDIEAAKVTQAAMQEINRRSRDVGDPLERKRLRSEVLAGLQVPQVTVARVADHIEHIRAVAGAAAVGLGSDFDGSDFWPEGLSDVSMYPTLFAELIRRGWSDAELKMLAGENLLRALRQAEAVSAQMQRQGAAGF